MKPLVALCLLLPTVALADNRRPECAQLEAAKHQYDAGQLPNVTRAQVAQAKAWYYLNCKRTASK